MEGWIKLHRRFIKWEWFNDSNMIHLFIYLLLQANHEPNKWRGITIERGQILTGRKSINNDTGISEQSIRTCLDRLKSTSEITIKSTNKFSVITVCNYDSYQEILESTNQLANQQLTNNQPTTNQQLTTNKNDKKEKNVKNDKKEIPFDSDNFKNAWEKWEKHRREIRHKLTPTTIESQFEMLGTYSEETAIKMIKKSIEKGWQGLFELKDNSRKPNPLR